eukprot:scaffold152204_cov18-Tisochrysis_lutea.AAC.1
MGVIGVACSGRLTCLTGAEGPEKLQEVGAVALRSGSLAAVMRSIQLQVRLQGKGAVSKNAVGAVVLRSGSIAALYAAHVSRHCANLVTRWVARKGAISQSAKVALIKALRGSDVPAASLFHLRQSPLVQESHRSTM